MNILFVSDTYYPHVNGVYFFVCRIGPLLRARGHQVAVIAPAAVCRFTKKEIDTIDVYGMPSLPVLLYPKVRVPVRLFLRSGISRVLKSFKPDVIHIQDHFLISREVIKLSREFDIPVIGTNHFIPENKLWCRFSKVYNQVSVVTTPTETAARMIRPRLGVAVVAVSSGVDLDRFAPGDAAPDMRRKYGIPPGPVLLFVGRLGPEKKIEQILEAVKLAGAFAEFTFVVAGRGMREPALRNLAHQLGIGHRVVFTGFVAEADLPHLYRASRCFIIANDAELLSLATLQALACGLPVIAENAGALQELVKDNGNGYLFAPGDVAAMSRSIIKLMTNDWLCRRMSEKSLQIAPAHDLRGVVDIFEGLYEDECCNWILR